MQRILAGEGGRTRLYLAVLNACRCRGSERCLGPGAYAAQA